jgi:hypothetical protein
LAVFAGGLTLESAEAVANHDGDLDVLAGMSSLIDKSLVRQIDRADGEPRFTMLETIREFALDQLGRHPSEEAAARNAHATYFADLAIAVRPGLGFGQPEAIRRVRADQSNFRAAITQILANGDAETALWAAGSSLYQYWLVAGGHFNEGRAWLEQALRQGVDASVAARVWGFHAASQLACFQGDLAAAREAAEACCALARGSPDPYTAVLGPVALSIIEDAMGHVEAAMPLGMEAVVAARALDDPSWLGWTLYVLGSAQWRAGRPGEATGALNEALALFRGLDSEWGQADALMLLAGVARTEGDLGRAARLHAESLRTRQAYGEMIGIYDDLVGLAAVAHAAGRYAAAARLLGADEAFCARSGYQGYGVTPEVREDTRQSLEVQLGGAPFRQAWDAGRALSTEEAIAEALAVAEEMALTPD